MFMLFLFPILTIILYVVIAHFQELAFMNDAMHIFYAKLPDFISWLPLPVTVLMLFTFGGAIVLRILGRI